LTTATGFKLKTRYTELGFLLTEGLAGVTDPQLTIELENTVRQGTNPQIRAAALVDYPAIYRLKRQVLRLIS